MSKLIIWVGGRPSLNGYRIREFQWVPAHACYVYGGAAINAADFNAAYEKALKTNSDLHPKVRVVEAGDAPQIAPAPAETKTAVLNVATVAVKREPTVEEAEAVMIRLAPERLKKKPGPARPAVMEVA